MKKLIVFLVILIGCRTIEPPIIEPSGATILVDTVYVPILNETPTPIVTPCPCDTNAILAAKGSFTTSKLGKDGSFYYAQWNAVKRQFVLTAKAKDDTTRALWTVIDRLNDMNMIAQKPVDNSTPLLSKFGLVLVGFLLAIALRLFKIIP
jgi:hypothetical protein